MVLNLLIQCYELGMKMKSAIYPLLRMATLTQCLFLPAVTFANEPMGVDVYYDDLTHIVTDDGNTHLKLEARIQTRLSKPFDNNPSSLSKLKEAEGSDIDVNRSRLKAGGHIFRPWIGLKYEYDTTDNRLLDARLTLKHSDALQFRFGRMKAHYSNERVASSKDQMMVDRSMVNDYFTLDRQQGVSLLGRFAKGEWYDSSYWFDVFSGTGRDGSDENNDFMYVARYQWNLLGETMKTAMSDPGYTQKPAAFIAFATSTNKSRYTRFTSDGAKGLQNFDIHDEDDGFKLEQWMLESRYKYNGLAIDAEYHQKRVIDEYDTMSTYYSKHIGGDSVRMKGFYVQAGYHPHRNFPSVPKQLELTARYAETRPDTKLSENKLSEITLGANVFFNKHRNKITLDVGYYEVEEDALFGTGRKADDIRFRLQHDFSF